jgi:hypothetical protein
MANLSGITHKGMYVAEMNEEFVLNLGDVHGLKNVVLRIKVTLL